MTALPSRTSIWAASARAVGSRAKQPHWRNPDHLADKLMGRDELALIAGHPLAEALAQPELDVQQNPEVFSAAMTLIVRTKFIDERLLRMVNEGATQIVVMGAGWDTRAYRFHDQLKGVRAFEVDQPSTQDWKRRRAEEVLGPPPSNLSYLTIDFRTQTLESVLLAGGYDPAQRTMFIWEGVTMYLPDQAVRDTLHWISTQAPGSMVVFDFADRILIDFIEQQRTNPLPLEGVAKVGMDRLRQIAGWGEPWIFGISMEKSGEYLEQLGLEHRETLGMASQEAAQRYLGWTEDRPFPAAIRQLYALAEAVVPAR